MSNNAMMSLHPDLIRGAWRESSASITDQFSNPWLSQLIDLCDVFNHASTRFFRQRGLRAAYLPLTTHSVSSPAAPGSDSLPVEVELCGIRTYLADSMQFLLEYVCRFQPKGVFYVMPSFRGEAPDARHLSQFFHAEAEIAGSLEDVMELVEAYVRSLVSAFLEETEEGVLANLNYLARAADGPSFRRLAVDDALEILADVPQTVEKRNGALVISAAGERFLLRELGGGPLWLVGHDAAAMPFYQARTAGDPRRTRSADLLMGIGETVGAGERHATGDATAAALAEQGIDPVDYAWYLEMKYAAPLQTSGFGLGVERFLLWLTGHTDIRDMQVIPRANGQRLIP
ncbi:MAG TPA: amino acid--tRNA ligase-related protein [Thermoanaerobaculia bacterium]|nr:amino acid--tRNA ligase-related protein [Thermoanaerobaculia bacterium]